MGYAPLNLEMARFVKKHVCFWMEKEEKNGRLRRAKQMSTIWALLGKSRHQDASSQDDLHPRGRSCPSRQDLVSPAVPEPCTAFILGLFFFTEEVLMGNATNPYEVFIGCCRLMASSPSASARATQLEEGRGFIKPGQRWDGTGLLLNDSFIEPGWTTRNKRLTAEVLVQVDDFLESQFRLVHDEAEDWERTSPACRGTRTLLLTL
ncbi:LOW QUALITY PROTEIN: hypothetical protein QTO34_001959 [Cnephaeus nilssonii]|uniref:Uncharacterized protein n=1 Tax=Cnephaeus nilssonii TaxID=3371016 RepID=A0AA40LMV9_CNENI|nr:LOW QUALITY PROTEIN: hypothetical protein QTO34_001959 [Eptesicus nilssonii]